MKRDSYYFEKLTWEEYKRNRDEYGFCSSWALWDDGILRNKSHCSVEEGYDLGRGELLLAKSEEEFYRKKLNVKLNKNVVFLALNSSFNVQETGNNDILKVYKKYNDIYNSNHKLTKDDCKNFGRELKEITKKEKKYVFSNMWGDAGSGNKRGAGYYKPIKKNEKATELLSGAYITDFIKINNGVCCAIPESDSNKMNPYLRGDRLDEQIDGLKEELGSLGIKHPNFVLLHSKLDDDCLKNKLRKEYGDATFIGRLPHYSPRCSKFMKCSFPNYEEMFRFAMNNLTKEMIEWKKEHNDI